MNTHRHLIIVAILLIGSTLSCRLLPGGETSTPVVPLPPIIIQTDTPAVVIEPLPVVDPTLQPVVPVFFNCVDYGHIHFCLDTVHASGYNAQTIPAQNQNDAPMWDIMPETTQIDFTGYELSGTFHSPHLMVWSIDSYGQVSESAKTNIDDLKQILQEKPVDPERVPFLPLWNAAQMFVAKPQYLRFQNGNGIRFLSMYGQAAYPVAGDKLIYIYQGISDDNTQYISVVLPVTNPNLPPDQSTNPNFDWNTFSETFPEYLVDIKAQLNGWPDDSYSPILTDLDLFINSIQLIP